MTHRHFGIEPRFAPVVPIARAKATPVPPRPASAGVANQFMSGRQRLGGMSTLPSTSSAGGTRADLIPLPCGSLIDPGSAPLKRGYLLQTLIDLLAIGAGALLVSATASVIAFSVFVLFFVELH